ncbi:MAG: Na/Pi cotransporter family protein [Solobacterium sp.]|nr:Na/Pi cotransporter family protein [Solobacterium sp.]
MNFFNILTLFGGLAMFLYGMRLMGDGLKESSSGTLKIAMEHVTNNPFKAFLLGAVITAIIQSSTATIVITSGLVGAGIITLHQSLGIIIGANVGTTVTGQIIRLLDIGPNAAGWLQLFKPSSLAPIALIAGIVLIMGFNFRNSKTIGNILIGFGILFSGLLTMTNVVDDLAATGVFDSLFANLSGNPVLGYLTGAAVAFVLQSSSATIGILQAFSLSGQLLFKAVYSVIVGVYLGDCVTTAIVISIGGKPDARRVGIVNIIYNLSKSVLVLIGVFLFHQLGLLDGLWEKPVNPGIIADTNTIFNLACAFILLPFINFFERSALKIVRSEPAKENKYKDKLEALSPAFFSTPALALRSCYDVLAAMLDAARRNIDSSFAILKNYNEKTFQMISEEEDNIDLMTDHLSNYLAQLSGTLKAEEHVQILNEYYKLVNEFERLGDYAMNISEIGRDLAGKNIRFSAPAQHELDVLQDLIDQILDRTDEAFRHRSYNAAREIEPLEEVVDDLVDILKTNHLGRLANGKCNVYSGTDFIDTLSNIERISDTCSNVGFAILARIRPDVAGDVHDYAGFLHSGQDEDFNRIYRDAHQRYFDRLNKLIDEQKISDESSSAKPASVPESNP